MTYVPFVFAGLMVIVAIALSFKRLRRTYDKLKAAYALKQFNINRRFTSWVGISLTLVAASAGIAVARVVEGQDGLALATLAVGFAVWWALSVEFMVANGHEMQRALAEPCW